jgi:hypothetical protein
MGMDIAPPPSGHLGTPVAGVRPRGGPHEIGEFVPIGITIETHDDRLISVITTYS